MSLIKFNETFPALLDSFFGHDMGERFAWPRTSFSVPAVNIREDENSFKVEMAAPGMKKEDFKVTLDNGILTVSSENHQANEEKDNNGKYTKREFSYQSFSRSFSLPDTVQYEKIDAKYQDGILHLTIPKKEEAKRKAPKLINIA